MDHPNTKCKCDGESPVRSFFMSFYVLPILMSMQLPATCKSCGAKFELSYQNEVLMRQTHDKTLKILNEFVCPYCEHPEYFKHRKTIEPIKPQQYL